MKAGVYTFYEDKEPKDLENEIKKLKKQLKIAIKTLKTIIKEDMYNLDEHRIFIEKKLKQIKELENEK